MKKIVIRTVKSLAFVALMFLSSSCTKTTLETEENPIVLSSDAQEKVTHIKNLLAISSNDPNVEQDSGNAWNTVKNDWIYCYLKVTRNITQDIKIEVKENMSTESRTIELVIISESSKGTLIITQLGKTE